MPSASQSPHVTQLRLVVEAEDFDDAVAFYRDSLGLTEQAAFEGDGDARVVILSAGRATLELANPAQKRMIDAVEVGRQVSPKLRVAFEVSDSAEITDALVRGGATLIAPPTETPWRSLNSRLDAPAGLQITLFEELGPTVPDPHAAPSPIGPGATDAKLPDAMPAVRRLGTSDVEVARETFTLMAAVFGEQAAPLSDGYIHALLARPEMWILAATIDGRIVGGLTAHTLAMTVFEGAEVFLYDIAVSDEVQRRGVGRNLVRSLLDAAAGEGIETVFVPADDEDTHALDFYRAMNGRPTAVTMFDLGRSRE